MEYGATGEVLSRSGNRGVGAAPQGLYACAGHENWLALAVETEQQWAALRAALGDPGWAADPALATADGRRAAHDRVDKELGAWTATREVDELVELLARHGVPAAEVVDARDIAFNPQLAARGFFEVEDHPVTGPHPVPVMPFRFASRRTEGWMRRPSPTVGQHNDEVLRELGLADADLAGLRERAIIGERPLGA